MRFTLPSWSMLQSLCRVGAMLACFCAIFVFVVAANLDTTLDIFAADRTSARESLMFFGRYVIWLLPVAAALLWLRVSRLDFGERHGPLKYYLLLALLLVCSLILIGIAQWIRLQSLLY